MLPDTTARSVVLNGAKTHYHEAGDGPAVILLHGSGPGVSAWANWNKTFAGLQDRFHLVAPDLVGFGRTERAADQTYGLHVWVEQVLALMDELKIDSAHMLGNSMGGRITLALAAKVPERTNRLVLMGTPGPDAAMTEGLKAVRSYKPSWDNMARVIREFFAYDKDFAPDSLIDARYEASIEPGVQEAYEKMFSDETGPEYVLDEATIQSVTNATLVVHGREDRVVPFETGVRLFDLIRNSALRGFSSCGHWVQLEHAAEFNDLVSDFLQRPINEPTD